MHEYQITVRGYEIDSFGHVNNAVYLNYCEQARWEILRSLDLFDYFRRNRLILVVTEADIRYIKEALVFDELIIVTDIAKEAPYLVFNHVIARADSGERITRASIKTLLVDGERVPHDIPDLFIERFAAIFQE
ncbi:MAG TPA: acyl-CoA thioesterase [Spirochaetota bacterium]|nr:acyl-CoA thioesterase [Spirochaetota bacterium]HOD15693.1 acyl-CoA thioesterase [Spirochaetota bacterium]HPG49875.1 acyl-CoA thioesterase [Spirochaetota bacterium]HPN12537.1 acyl-CoA thioesterase [Spirochaetota bacterium]HQL81961.1 acyl-CoA thioesterase [Spirochaetota bacterium]